MSTTNYLAPRGLKEQTTHVVDELPRLQLQHSYFQNLIFFQVLTLGLAGGVNLKDTVWRVMKQLIQNDLACKINWTGLNGKMAFKSLEIRNVVTGKSCMTLDCVD